MYIHVVAIVQVYMLTYILMHILDSQRCSEETDRKKGFGRVNIYDVMYKNITHI